MLGIPLNAIQIQNALRTLGMAVPKGAEIVIRADDGDFVEMKRPGRVPEFHRTQDLALILHREYRP